MAKQNADQNLLNIQPAIGSRCVGEAVKAPWLSGVFSFFRCGFWRSAKGAKVEDNARPIETQNKELEVKPVQADSAVSQASADKPAQAQVPAPASASVKNTL